MASGVFERKKRPSPVFGETVRTLTEKTGRGQEAFAVYQGPEFSVCPKRFQSKKNDAQNYSNVFQKKPLDHNNEVHPKSVHGAHLPEVEEEVLDRRRLILDDFYGCAEYAEDIHRYLQEIEKKWIINKAIFSENGHIMTSRTILVDWMIQVQVYLEISDNTLHASVAYVDRFLSFQIVPLKKIQLLGVASLFIAVKFHETWTLKTECLLYLTDNAYTRDQLLSMEQQVLRVLNFELGAPSAHAFLDWYLEVYHSSDKVKRLSRYALDLSLPCPDWIQFSASLKASAALIFSHKVLREDAGDSWDWSTELYASHHLSDCTKMFFDCFMQAPCSKQQGASAKHSSSFQYSIKQADVDWIRL